MAALDLRGRQESDYRFSLANERTLLAWIRTALAVVTRVMAVLRLSLDRLTPSR
jgi:putative membrane protein